MTDLRKAAEMALAALKGAWIHDPEAVQKEIAVLEQALEKPQTRIGEMEWHWGYERGWDKAMEAKREWVGLKDDEIYKVIELLEIEDRWNHVAYHLAKTVEIKLRNKNT